MPCANTCRNRSSEQSTDAETHGLEELCTRIRDILFKLQLWAFEIGLNETNETNLASSYELDLVTSILNRMQRQAEDMELLCKKSSVTSLLSMTQPMRPEDDLLGDLADLDLSDEESKSEDANSVFEL